MKLIKSLFIIAITFLGVIASPAYADLYPGYHAIDPLICTPYLPPPPPAEGSPGWTLANPLDNGSYYDPATGLWYFPDGLWIGEMGVRMIEVIEEIQALVWPYWATSDAWDGRYWYPGGFTNNGSWYPEGYYYPSEIY